MKAYLELIFVLMALLLASCGEPGTANTFPVVKCGLIVQVDNAWNVVSGLSQYNKFCETGKGFSGGYEGIDTTVTTSTCGFWVIKGQLITLDNNELTTTPAREQVCN